MDFWILGFCLDFQQYLRKQKKSDRRSAGDKGKKFQNELSDFQRKYDFLLFLFVYFSNISETMRSTGDPLVSKSLDLQGLFKK